MPKQNPKRRWAKWNTKLEPHDTTIDLADIGHLSKRAYATGYLSRKVIKKWRSRARKTINSGYCKGPCQWLPATVLKIVSLNKYGKPSFWWRCRKCGCVTKWVWDDELSLPMLNAYREHTRNKEEEENRSIHLPGSEFEEDM